MKLTYIAMSLVTLVLFSAWMPVHAETISLKVEVDARELPRKLLHTRMEIPVRAGELRLWYPKWIPGIHSPGGPVQNMGGLRIETKDGDTIAWQRDEEEFYQFICTIPPGVDTIVVQMDYICSQPSVNSSGVDSFGNAFIGVINWNTCLLYPDGYSSNDILLDVSLRLPEGWRHASSLKLLREEDGVVTFAPTSLHDLVDSPLIAGEYFRTVQLDTEDTPPIYLDIVSESPAALQLSDELIAHYGRMATEAVALFGGAHFEEYRLLLTCSDDLPYNGLEHLRSSYNGVGERDLLDEDQWGGWVGYLLPHEFAHSWCGKFRRPAGMDTPDFHTPKRTKGLWVYEGLDQYLGEILAVRSGLWDLDHHRELLALKISNLMHQTGREWRPLIDTAVVSGHLRSRSRSWSNLRRSQDYYNEGLLLWLEADAIIRQQSDGTRSLDDFCERFFGPDQPEVDVHPWQREEIVETLNELAEFDWAAFIANWLESPLESLPLDVVSRLGYRLQYGTEPSDYLAFREKDRGYMSAMDSLGISVNDEGVVYGNLVPGMPGEQAGLAPGMEIVGVNGRKFSLDRVRDAIADSVTRGNIAFLILDGDRFDTITVDYDDGPRYLELVRDDSKPDIHTAIFSPVVTQDSD